MTKHPLSEGDDGDGDDGGGGGGRISWPPTAPFPITPRDSISRSGIPLTPIKLREHIVFSINLDNF